ncbi:penicillin-binding transpeptidase domain-containing protein [Pseudonocardia sulfidoxydans]|uniref:penicillin-binding transpeptidase domain-containing protein n=1 Tax=Pseudonocardia sulfidoxydans TaxID=54011 RepID=UPI001FEB4E4B|nr:penicillin-binding transpeptidase domain-containing protein [Pseudonocardia sulfidoxydans]
MTAPRRRALSPLRLGLLAGLLVIALVGAGCAVFGPSGEEKAVQAYLDAWTRGDDAAAARLTDDPAAAQAALADTRKALAPAGLTATLGQVRTAGDDATASVDVAWDLGQDRRFAYLGEIGVRRSEQADSGWLVHWTPAAIHPKLAAGQRLSLVADTPDPAPVVDRGGTPLLAPTPVVNILLDRTAAGDLGAVTGTLARALAPLVPGITAQSIADGAGAVPQGQGYSVAVLRDTDYRTVKDAIHDLPGVRFATQTRLLAQSAGFGSQVLTPVRTEVTPQVTGIPGWSVQILGGGATIATLQEQPPTPGTTVTLSIDHTVQNAAEDAVESLPQQVALVALSPSTGDILAVAQNTQADAAGAIALTGRYPPGSTFKIVTATAALETLGVTADSPQPCPGTTTIDGRLVPNEDRFELGTVPLTQAFARSCNTTFSQLAAQMTADALPAAGLSLGFGADFAIPGLTTVTGSVPPAPDRVQRAEDGFGQGDVVATPFGMALVAATVARGAPVVPQLIRGRATDATTPATAPPPQAVLDQLRPMMRAVVTSGTATALARSGEVFGKTGTAEYSVNGANRSHGWFVGYRGDVAFAVLVVDGGSSGPAVGVAQRFLAALG